MRRHTVLVAAVMASLALAGGGTALVASSGLFGSGFETGAGQLPPVLTPRAQPGAQPEEPGSSARDSGRAGEEPGHDDDPGHGDEREEAETTHVPGGDDDD